MFKWLHHLLNPHCPDCISDREEALVCKSCDILQKQLDIVNHEKRQLIDRLLNPSNVTTVASDIKVETESLKSKHIPWRVKQQMLEADDREKARLMRQFAESKDTKIPEQITIESLEKELGLIEVKGNG